jgi:hypothetical protein
MAMAISRRMAQQPGAGTARPMLPQGNAGAGAALHRGKGNREETSQYIVPW